MYLDEIPNDDKLKLLVLTLQAKLGRLPTESEIVNFIFGDKDTRKIIWDNLEP